MQFNLGNFKVEEARLTAQEEIEEHLMSVPELNSYEDNEYICAVSLRNGTGGDDTAGMRNKVTRKDIIANGIVA